MMATPSGAIFLLEAFIKWPSPVCSVSSLGENPDHLVRQRQQRCVVFLLGSVVWEACAHVYSGN